MNFEFIKFNDRQLSLYSCLCRNRDKSVLINLNPLCECFSYLEYVLNVFISTFIY